MSLLGKTTEKGIKFSEKRTCSVSAVLRRVPVPPSGKPHPYTGTLYYFSNHRRLRGKAFFQNTRCQQIFQIDVIEIHADSFHQVQDENTFRHFRKL